jgi:hypothetical protein
MKKALKWIGIIFLILIVILIAVPFLFKDKIVAKVKAEANKNLNAKFDFGDFDLSLIRSFPNLSIGIEKLSIINVAPFAGDTLIYAKQLDLTVDIMSVIGGGTIQIKKVNMDSPVMNFLVNEKGIANWDIAKASEEEKAGEPSSFKASLQKYSINDGLIVYNDLTMPFFIRLEGLDHTGKGDFTQDLFVLSTKTTSEKLDLVSGGVKYISQAKVNIDADLDMNMKDMKFTFKDNKISLNELKLGFSGWLAMPDTNMDMDLKFSAAESDFGNFVSMIPAVYSNSVKDLKSSGKISFDGFAKGRYNANSLPGFGINLNIDNGMFKYTSLPASVNNVFVDLKISNPDGVPDHTAINLSRLHVEMNGDPFDARLFLTTPVSDPNIDASMKGKLDLGGVQKFIPLEKGTSLSGIITADVNVKGRMSSVEQKRYDQFDAGGTFGISNMKYTSADSKQPIGISSLKTTVSPQNINMSECIASAGKTSFSANGYIDNILGYMLKDELIRGELSISSPNVDLNEFMGGEEPVKRGSDTTQLSVLDVPGNIDFTLNASVAKLIYQNIIIKNVKGKVIIKDRAIRMQDVFMQLMDGSMSMNGAYSSADLKKPVFNFDVNAKDFDIQKTVTSFATVEKLAPIAKNCTGKFSVVMAVNGDLDSKMSPLLNTIGGAGKLFTTNIIVDNFPAFTKIADVLKMPSWKRLNIPSVNPSFKFVNGRVYVDPFDMTVGNIKSTIAGSNGFDQTVDYTMAAQIPRAAMGGAANSVLNNLVSQANAKGANFTVGDVIPLNILITGTVKDPKISTDLNKAGASVMNDLKAKAEEEFNKKKEEAEARVRAEADKLKNEAEAKLQSEKQKAAVEADKIKKEAEAKAKARADSLKKAAEQKAKDQLKQINPFKK